MMGRRANRCHVDPRIDVALISRMDERNDAASMQGRRANRCRVDLLIDVALIFRMDERIDAASMMHRFFKGWKIIPHQNWIDTRLAHASILASILQTTLDRFQNRLCESF
jgi:hypothetical protein